MHIICYVCDVATYTYGGVDPQNYWHRKQEILAPSSLDIINNTQSLQELLSDVPKKTRQVL